MVYTFTTETTISSEMVSDLIDTAGYGIGYWATSATKNAQAQTLDLFWDGSDLNFDSPWVIGERTLTYVDLAKAIEKVAKGNAGVNSALVEQAQQWLNGGFGLDVDLADVVIQTATFGEIVYG